MIFISLLRILTMLLGIVGTTFLVPAVTAVCCGETAVLPAFLVPMLCSWILAGAVNLSFRRSKFKLSVKSTFVIVAAAWISASLFGAVPLYASGYMPSFTDAVFESVSGFTTTGATILGELESLPRSVNVWRCMTHWLGGMGIVALTVALLPLLGVGGFQLIKAETTGPEKGKVTPKITTTAKYLWLIYCALTALQTVLLLLCGMDFIDAVSHAFSTLGTGGFSSNNASVGGYHSAAVDVVCTVFMFLAGVNFSLYYYAVVRKFQDIRENSEWKAYVGIFVFGGLLLSLLLLPVYRSLGQSMRFGFFQTASIVTTTGFVTADYAAWPTAAQFIIFVLFFIGGCSGSTGGGIKVIRWVVLFKQVSNETKRILHPHGIFSIRLNNKPGRKDIVFSVTSFILLYILLVLATTLVGCIGRLDLFTAFTAALSMVGNVGPGFGALGPTDNYGWIPGFVKWWYSFAMLAGRLELYTMIIFFLPAYWKK
ncbi:MAG: TrkH family potassium uptake protein [Treponemataceae bacterium]|nr:TrkH family potassium uptake protein [Treponemataceae bacterium]